MLFRSRGRNCTEVAEEGPDPRCWSSTLTGSGDTPDVLNQTIHDSIREMARKHVAEGQRHPYVEAISRYITCPPEDSKIWHFLSLEAFLFVLQKQQLYFRPLSQHRDQLEGFIPPDATDVLEEIWKACLAPGFETQRIKLLRDVLCIHCWHINTVQSAAMWDLYSRSSGICIQSTVQSLRSSLNITSSAATLHIGEIRYLTTAEGIEGKIVVPGFAKRKSFEHEHELRAAVMNFPSVIPATTREHGHHVVPEETPNWLPHAETGMTIPVDVEHLIHAVYISPESPRWVIDVVGKTVKLHGFKSISVSQSDLYSSELW